MRLCIGNLKLGEMELGKMKRNTSNWSNFCILLRRAGLSASAGLSCLFQRCNHSLTDGQASDQLEHIQMPQTIKFSMSDLDVYHNIRGARLLPDLPVTSCLALM